MVIALFFLKTDQDSLKELIPIFGLYSVIILRLIPLFTQINQNIQTIRLSKVQIGEVIKNINDHNQSNLEKLLNINNKSSTKNNIDLIEKIKIENVSFFYKKEKYILRNVDLELNKNKTFYFEGNNGSGKSTLVDLISGMLVPSEGKIKVNNVDINNNLDAWQKNIGYVSQTTFLINDTIKENIVFGRRFIDEKNLEDVIKLTDLDKLIDSLPDKINTVVGNLGSKLSGGQKQKIMIARALVNNPSVIILDESTNSLDLDAESNFLNIINRIKRDRIIIFIAHSDLIKNFCDEKFIIKDKKIAKYKKEV